VAGRPELLRRIALPSSATADARLLIGSRAIRAFGDGFVSVLLAVYLRELGFSGLQIGVVTTATLLGSASFTLVLGLLAHRLPTRRTLRAASMLMALTGIGFAVTHDFWPLLIVAFVGTLNPSSGDVSVFLPLEQSLLPRTVSDSERTGLFARYSFMASIAGACGALTAGVPEVIAERTELTLRDALSGMFLVYAVIALIAFAIYRQLSPAIEPEGGRTTAPLGESKRIVYLLAALFSLDSFGSGLIVQSLLALYLFERYDLAVATTGSIFFFTSLLAAVSYPIAVWLSRRIGLLNTMVFSHLPANIILMLVPFMPNVQLAVGLLLLRSALSQMDVPTRNSYVMAVVTPAERPATASVTAVPRSLASAAAPLLSGVLFGMSTFGWPLIVAGALKGIYDLLLLALFKRVRPPEER
jgi:MFS family permease